MKSGDRIFFRPSKVLWGSQPNATFLREKNGWNQGCYVIKFRSHEWICRREEVMSIGQATEKKREELSKIINDARRDEKNVSQNQIAYRLRISISALKRWRKFIKQ